jgi:hypothetical protein
MTTSADHFRHKVASTDLSSMDAQLVVIREQLVANARKPNGAPDWERRWWMMHDN